MNNEMYNKLYNYTLYFYDREKENFLDSVHREIAKMLPKNYLKIKDEIRQDDTMENTINDFFFLKYEQIKSLQPGQWLLENVKEYFENYYEPLENEEIEEISYLFWNNWTAANRDEIDSTEIEAYEKEKLSINKKK